MFTRAVIVAVGLLMLVSCSGDEGTSAAAPDSSEPTGAESAQEEAAPGESTPEESTPEESAERAPTTAPTPEPPPELLVQVDLPIEAASSPWRAIWGAAPPTVNAPWVGFGHRHDAAIDESVPVVWVIPGSGEPAFEDLPLPDGVTRGFARGGGTAFGDQLGVGEVTIDDSLRAAYWSRSSRSNQSSV